MKGPVVLLSIPALLAGCASMASNQPTNYDDLPGSGDNMAKGPGLFAYGQRDSYEGGYRVFSDDPDKPALIHPPGKDGQRQAKRSETATASSDRSAASAGASTGSEPSQQQRSQYQQFEEYQQFKNFQSQPENSSERRKFREWQDWKQYQQWKNGG